MTRKLTSCIAVVLAVLGCIQSARSQTSPPFSAEERESIYTTTIDKRTRAITELLSLSDATKSNVVHQTIMAQYRSLRARDAAVDAMLQSLDRDMPGVESNRSAVVQLLSKRLHGEFLAKLANDLSPAQIEIVKDRMTYNKVQVTYDAYCQIVPGLTDKEKAMILDTLKLAREEAIDGGSADEKSAIFQKYKDQINTRLAAGGHDVAKATQEWETKQATAKPASPANQ
jgi:Protein of unknown function (DUF3826)